MGKVLKRSLRELLLASGGGAGPDGPADGPAGGAGDGAGVPATRAQARLGALWARVLGARDVRPDDEFFARGGDSLAATRLTALVAAEFGVRMPAAVVFERPRLADQAGWLERAAAPAAAPSRVPVPEPADGPPPRSALQDYFLRWMHETEPPRVVAAVPVALRVTDPIDPGALRRALRAVVRRHDALRTAFRRRSGEYRVEVAADPEVPLVTAVAPGVGLAARRHAAGLLLAGYLGEPYDLSSPPLLRAMLVRLGPDDHVFGVAVHHLVYDGWSSGVLLRELARCYDAFRRDRPSPLPATGPSSLDAYARAAAHWPANRVWWRDALAGVPAGPDRVPGWTDTDRFTARAQPLRVEPGLAARLRAVARAERASPYQALLAAWAAVLADWTGTDEVLVMSPVPGRTRPEDEGVIGCLVQSLLLRLDTSGRPPFPEAVRRARDTVLAAADHQFFPYEEFSRGLRPAWLRYESWAAPAHLPGLASRPFPLPRELMFDWPLVPAERGPTAPELALTEQPDGALEGWLVANGRALPPAAVTGLGEAFLRFLGDAASGVR
jgi:hypothetical protein